MKNTEKIQPSIHYSISQAYFTVDAHVEVPPLNCNLVQTSDCTWKIVPKIQKPPVRKLKRH